MACGCSARAAQAQPDVCLTRCSRAKLGTEHCALSCSGKFNCPVTCLCCVIECRKIKDSGIILESLYKSGTSRIFSSLLCQLCYKRRSCHIRKDALQLSQLPPQVQWGIAASPPWPNLAQFQKSLPLRVSSDWLRSSKTQQRKVKNFIFLYRTGFQIIWKNMFSPL